MGAASAVKMIEQAGLAVPEVLETAARTGEPKKFFSHPTINIGKYFVAG